MKETMQTSVKHVSKDSEEMLNSRSPFLRPFSPGFDPLRYSEGKSHFQFAFLAVPTPEHRALLDSFYAFCRIADDIVDEPADVTDRVRAIHQLREWCEKAGPIGHFFWDDFLRRIQNVGLPMNCLLGILDGVQMDLPGGKSETGFSNWSELEVYIEGVAVDVGRGVLHILGATGKELDEYATHLGRSVQLVNFCRDLEEDILKTRFYFPQELKGEPLSKIREILWTRAISEWAKSKPYSWRCLAPELMVRIYLEAGLRWWRFGNKIRLRKSQKIQFAIKHVFLFIAEGLGIMRPWMK